MPGPGKIDVQRMGLGGLSALLYNFDVGRSVLKPEHLQWITGVLLPWSAPPGLKTLLIGMTSTTGSEALNWALSKARTDAVSWELFRLTRKTRVAAEMRSGKTAARLAGLGDGIEHERWRAVFVNVSDNTGPWPGPDSRMIRLISRPLSRTYLIKSGMKMEDDEPGAKAAKAARGVMRELWGPPLQRSEDIEVDTRFVLTDIRVDDSSDAYGPLPLVADYEMTTMKFTFTWDKFENRSPRGVKLWSMHIFSKQRPTMAYRFIPFTLAHRFLDDPYFAYREAQNAP